MNEPLVTIDKVAEHFSVQAKTVRLWVKQGKIPKGMYARIGKNTMRFKLHEIEKLFTEGETGDMVADPSEENQEEVPKQYVLDFYDDDQGDYQ